jgi:hypothetical protein
MQSKLAGYANRVELFENGTDVLNDLVMGVSPF